MIMIMMVINILSLLWVRYCFKSFRFMSLFDFYINFMEEGMVEGDFSKGWDLFGRFSLVGICTFFIGFRIWGRRGEFFCDICSF